MRKRKFRVEQNVVHKDRRRGVVAAIDYDSRKPYFVVFDDGTEPDWFSAEQLKRLDNN